MRNLLSNSHRSLLGVAVAGAAFGLGALGGAAVLLPSASSLSAEYESVVSRSRSCLCAMSTVCLELPRWRTRSGPSPGRRSISELLA
jgi:hypothetical protein